MSDFDSPVVRFAPQPVLPGRSDELRESIVVTPELQAWASTALARAHTTGTEIAYLGLLAEGRYCCDEGWIDETQWSQIKESAQEAQREAARRLVDDGQWLVEAGGKHIVPADRPYGFLEIRCKARLGAPAFLVVGGYEQLENGQWSADILTGKFPEQGDSYKVLGEFPNREAAVMALWSHRHEVALPKEREYAVDAGVQLAWNEATALAGGKGKVVFGGVAEAQPFLGQVLSVDAVYTVQNLGRSAVIHSTAALNRVPLVGEVMSCRYHASGIGIALAGHGQERSSLAR